MLLLFVFIWAIAGMTATADDAQEAPRCNCKTLVEIFGAEIADGIRGSYGGSAARERYGFLESSDASFWRTGGALSQGRFLVAMVKSAMN